MCLWWAKREPIESSFDPRFGSAAITAPTSGAYTDPSMAPPLTVAVFPNAIATDQPPSPLPMSTISQLPRFPNAKPASLNIAPSNRSSEAPSLAQPASSKSANARHSQHSVSTSTQFSAYNSTPSSPSSQRQPSPQWPKTSPSAGRPTSPVPVHQAYIPADQLSIGSKLSPGFSPSSTATPTTAGPRTGNSATTTVTNGWGSAQPSPTNILNSSKPSTPASSPPLPQVARMQEQQQQVQSILLPPVDQQQAVQQQQQQQQQQQKPRQSMQRLLGIQGTQASHPQSKAKMTRIALPSLKLGAVPKRKPAKTWERSPDSDIEQWPGVCEVNGLAEAGLVEVC